MPESWPFWHAKKRVVHLGYLFDLLASDGVADRFYPGLA